MARPARKKADIERAALELFVSKGVDGTSVRDIAARAGVTEGALYRHHTGKIGMVRDLFDRIVADIGERLEEAQQEASTPEEKIRAMVSTFFTLHDEDASSFEFVMLTRHSLLEELRGHEASEPVATIDRVVQEGIQEKSWPKQDVAVSTEMLLGMVMEVAVGKRHGRVKSKLVRLTDDVTNACLVVLRRDSEDEKPKKKKRK